MENISNSIDSISQTQLNSSPDLGKLFEALSKAQSEIRPAKLDMINPHYKSKYASIESCQNAYRDALAKFNLTLLQQVFSIGDQYYIRTILGHSSGQWISNIFRLMVGKKDMQGLGGSITYGRRYGVNALIGVVDTEDDDGNSSLPDKPKIEPKPNKEETKQLKNFAPTTEELKNESYFPGISLLDEFYMLVEEKGLQPDAVKKIIQAKLGVLKPSNKMTDDELEKVMKFIKATT